ncbi:MAG: hypothetical protein LBJ32_04285 [Oscillospiraceae bacterium]|nr:hypothetical protein [Oscillospiraceae bacterium]
MKYCIVSFSFKSCAGTFKYCQYSASGVASAFGAMISSIGRDDGSFGENLKNLGSKMENFLKSLAKVKHCKR